MAFHKMIEPVQRQLIHIAKARCGLSEDVYRDIIAAQTHGKKRSCKELTWFEADGVINYFVKKLGFKIQSKYIRAAGAARRARRQHTNARRRAGKTPDNVVALPSPDQLDMIRALSNRVDWTFEDGYERWRRKYMKIDKIKTEREASNVIEGLKGLLAHQIKRDDQGGEACRNG